MAGPQRFVDRHGNGGSGSGEGAGRRAGHDRAARRLGRRTLSGPHAVEAYLRASSPPRYMQRLRELETEYRVQRGRLEAAHRALATECGPDGARFSSRWRAVAEAWSFTRLNALVREHNAWYPIEANLPMDPRTRDSVAVRGASYRRLELGAAWILEHFPPAPQLASQGPPAPRWAPRGPA